MQVLNLLSFALLAVGVASKTIAATPAVKSSLVKRQGCPGGTGLCEDGGCCPLDDLCCNDGFCCPSGTLCVSGGFCET